MFLCGWWQCDLLGFTEARHHPLSHLCRITATFSHLGHHVLHHPRHHLRHHLWNSPGCDCHDYPAAHCAQKSDQDVSVCIRFDFIHSSYFLLPAIPRRLLFESRSCCRSGYPHRFQPRIPIKTQQRLWRPFTNLVQTGYLQNIKSARTKPKVGQINQRQPLPPAL